MDTKEEYNNQTFRLVGVTFNNSNGSSRQQLLEDIKLFRGSNGIDYKKGELSVNLVKYKFEDEDAIRVEVGIFKDVLGNISRKDLPFLLENYDYIHDIPNLDIYQGTPYGCSITVTFKNPDYEPTPPEPVVNITENSKPSKKSGLLSKLFKKK